MNIAPHLYSLYRDQGFSVVSGLNAMHWGGNSAAPFTKLLRGDKSVTSHIGISLYEVNFLESLALVAPARSILIIGNAYGWSSVALALANPGGRVAAIDAVLTPEIEEGMQVTNTIAKAASLPLIAVRGRSPEDVEWIAREHLQSVADLVLIDGLHTNKQVVIDFQAARQVASTDSIFLFHDVHNFDLYAAMDHVRRSGLIVRRLMATPSGMAIAFPPSVEALLAPVLAVYGPDEADLAVIQDLTNYRLKLRRRNWLRKLTGRSPLPLPY